MSGVVVPTTMKSMSSGVSPARSIALRAASTARSEVATPGSTIWRSRMPVRCRIHSSLVSTMRSRSALVSTRGGTYVARLAIRARQGGRDNVSFMSELPQGRILFRRRQPEILVGAGGRDAAARCAIEKACLNQERLVDILNRVLVFVDRGGQAVHANRTAAELVDDRLQQFAIDFVESLCIDLEELERIARHGSRN